MLTFEAKSLPVASNGQIIASYLPVAGCSGTWYQVVSRDYTGTRYRYTLRPSESGFIE